jgi:hypothetical protein
MWARGRKFSFFGRPARVVFAFLYENAHDASNIIRAIKTTKTPPRSDVRIRQLAVRVRTPRPQCSGVPLTASTNTISFIKKVYCLAMIGEKRDNEGSGKQIRRQLLKIQKIEEYEEKVTPFSSRLP